jgi:hypothetical protein
MVDTLIYLMGERVLLGPSVYYPTPGTPLFKQCEEMDILPSHPSQWRSSAFPVETKDFNRLDIISLFRLARVINFIKGKMDEMEFFNEGMTWKELFQVIKDKAKVKVEDEAKIKSSTPCARPYALCNENRDVTWMELLSLLFEERSFFSLRKNPDRSTSIFKEKSSKRVLDYFFEKAWESPVLKSRHN